ncbi:MAG: acyl-CoA thioesterase [Solirubrobacterales bacterium]|nr:acyl-CoA thioesterase [Solirubrobacterales bacterium]
MIDRPANGIRHPAETASILTYRTGVQDPNPAGNVHGGWVMTLGDDAAVIAATRFARCRVVTVTVDTFRSAVQVGDLLTLRATVNVTWRTSMEVGVQVESENVVTAQITHVYRLPDGCGPRRRRPANRRSAACADLRRGQTASRGRKRAPQDPASSASTWCQSRTTPIIDGSPNRIR